VIGRLQGFIGTIGIVHKKPISAELIVNGEAMAPIGEVDPGFGHIVGYKISDLRAV
jgi:hypothetical protein